MYSNQIGSLTRIVFVSTFFYLCCLVMIFKCSELVEDYKIEEVSENTHVCFVSLLIYF